MNPTYSRLALSAPFIEEAVARADELPVFKNSHRERAANLVGCIGELAFEVLLNRHDIKFVDDRTRTDLDYVVGSKFTVDVKTKDRTVRPESHFDCSVPLYNHDHQKPDYFFFVSLQRDKHSPESSPSRFTHAYLVGAATYEMIETKGKLWKKGQTDPANGTKFWTDCKNVKMNELLPVRSFIEEVGSNE